MFLTFFRNLFPENSGTIFPLTEIFRNNISERSGITEKGSGNFRFADKKVVSGIDPEFRNYETFSIIEMEIIPDRFHT